METAKHTNGTTRTRDEIESLKRNWVGDPCWDIEDTEGFEAHRAELVAFAKEMAEQWEAERLADEAARKRAAEAKAASLGAPGNAQLGGYVLQLEERLEGLQDQIEALQTCVPGSRPPTGS